MFNLGVPTILSIISTLYAGFHGSRIRLILCISPIFHMILDLAWLRSNFQNTNRTKVSVFKSPAEHDEDVSDDKLVNGMVAKTGPYGFYRQFSIPNTRMSIYPLIFADYVFPFHFSEHSVPSRVT